MRDFEKKLLDSSEALKNGFTKLMKNFGQAVAFVTAAVAILVTFTEVAFSTVTFESIAPSATALLVCSYIIYFSLEEAGERLGEESEEFTMAKARHRKAVSSLSGADAVPFRQFLAQYSKSELVYRREAALLELGLSREELTDYLSMNKRQRAQIPKERRCGLRKIAAFKPCTLTPSSLLGTEKQSRRAELRSPEGRKLPMLILKLLPSTLCMLITVCIVLNLRENMSASDVVNGIVKLMALPLSAFKGYSAGYCYVKGSLSAWFNTKAEIIEGYLCERTDIHVKSEAKA